MSFLGYWILSLIIWSFMLNVSLVIVIIFAFFGYYIFCKPLSYLSSNMKNFICNFFFEGFDIFEAYYQGFEVPRLIRFIFKLIFFFIIFFIAYFFTSLYLGIIN